MLAVMVEQELHEVDRVGAHACPRSTIERVPDKARAHDGLQLGRFVAVVDALAREENEHNRAQAPDVSLVTGVMCGCGQSYLLSEFG